jgi:Ca-activated chloride channel family protein
MYLLRYFLIFVFVISCTVSFAQIGTRQAQQVPPTRILLIFDFSNSMYGLWESDSKINIARKMVNRMVDSLAIVPNVQLALRAYGHQKKYPPQDCDDTKLEVPFSRDNAHMIKSRINTLQPKGTTPIAMSLEACAKDFPDNKGRNIVILITDGKEECGGDPCAIAQALQSKNIILKPFIVGVGKMDLEIIKSFDCVGNYYDAATENGFNQVLNIIITQILNVSTCQVNLLDKNGKPTETDVAMTFYDQQTGAVKHHFMHTMNNRGVPDTLRIDPMQKYRIKLHTIPEVEKNDVSLSPGKHTIIPIDAPQGFLKVQIGENEKIKDVNFVIRKAGDNNTLHYSANKETTKLIVGKYDLEIFTLPRTLVKDLNIAQSHTTTVKIDEPGIVSFQMGIMGYTTILMEEKGEWKWVCILNDNSTQDIVKLQPGNYKAVFRPKNSKETLFTIEKNFKVTAASSQQVLLK